MSVVEREIKTLIERGITRIEVKYDDDKDGWFERTEIWDLNPDGKLLEPYELPDGRRFDTRLDFYLQDEEHIEKVLKPFVELARKQGLI